MKLGNYVLVDGEPVEEPDIHKWARFMETPGARRVALDETPNGKVSTVFLGSDHRFCINPEEDGYRPLLYETMVFGGPLDQEGDRYCTREEALIGHAEWVRRVSGEPVKR